MRLPSAIGSARFVNPNPCYARISSLLFCVGLASRIGATIGNTQVFSTRSAAGVAELERIPCLIPC